MEIRHIPGKKNPADSLSRQLISDALVRKGSVKDANSEYVQRLRVSPDVSDSEIQTALHQLFSQGPQGQSAEDPQGRTVIQTALNQLFSQGLKTSQKKTLKVNQFCQMIKLSALKAISAQSPSPQLLQLLRYQSYNRTILSGILCILCYSKKFLTLR